MRTVNIVKHWAPGFILYDVSQSITYMNVSLAVSCKVLISFYTSNSFCAATEMSMTHTLHTCSAKRNDSNHIKCAATNVSLSCVPVLFWWLRLNVTKADCSGTTGSVGFVSRTIKQSEQFRLRLFHTTGNSSHHNWIKKRISIDF